MFARWRVIAAACVTMILGRFMPWDGIGDAVGVGHGAVIMRCRRRRLAIGLAGFRHRCRRMSVIVHIMGMTVLGHVLTAIVVMIVFDATRSFTRGGYVAAVVIRRIEVTLGLVRLTTVFRAAFALEATATATTTTTPTAATRATFTMTLMTAGLTRLRRAVLLQGDLLVQGLLAHGL